MVPRIQKGAIQTKMTHEMAHQNANPQAQLAVLEWRERRDAIQMLKIASDNAHNDVHERAKPVFDKIIEALGGDVKFA